MLKVAERGRNTMLSRYGVRAICLIAAALVAAASADAQQFSCHPRGPLLKVQDLPEASGVAASRRTPGVLWSHNDSGQPILVALTTDGAVRGRVRVTGAQVVDWEDISVGSCPQGSCVYIGDVGDNHANRRDIIIYRVPEPGPGDTATAAVETLRMTYPDGPRDAEALFVLPNGNMFIVTKGDGGPVALYRVPVPFRNGASVQLERVATLVPAEEKDGRRVAKQRRVTGASASSNGRWVVLRTHEAITFYAAEEFVAGKIREVFQYDVTPLGEPQGEGVAFSAGAEIWLAGEGGGNSRPGTLARLDCTLP